MSTKNITFMIVEIASTFNVMQIYSTLCCILIHVFHFLLLSLDLEGDGKAICLYENFSQRYEDEHTISDGKVNTATYDYLK